MVIAESDRPSGPIRSTTDVDTHEVSVHQFLEDHSGVARDLG